MYKGLQPYGKRGIAWKGASLANEALKTFFVSKGSADRDISVDRETLLLRARNLYQNSAFSGALINTLDINVVGTGLKLRPVLPRELLGLDRQAAREWEKKFRKASRFSRVTVFGIENSACYGRLLCAYPV